VYKLNLDPGHPHQGKKLPSMQLLFAKHPSGVHSPAAMTRSRQVRKCHMPKTS
jgi:hypothetical protein